MLGYLYESKTNLCETKQFSMLQANQPHEQARHQNSNVLHECNLMLRSQNNINVMDTGIKNHADSNGHDVNVNRVRSPLSRADAKWTSMSYV